MSLRTRIILRCADFVVAETQHANNRLRAALRIAKCNPEVQNDRVFEPGQSVRVNLAGMQVQGVLFHAAVTDAVGNIVRQIKADPPAFLVKLLFSFKGVSEVEVPADRLHGG